MIGDPTLRVIAPELVTLIKGNETVDWMHRDSARANIHVTSCHQRSKFSWLQVSASLDEEVRASH